MNKNDYLDTIDRIEVTNSAKMNLIYSMRTYSQKPDKKRIVHRHIKWIAICACFILCIILSIAAFQNLNLSNQNKKHIESPIKMFMQNDNLYYTKQKSGKFGGLYHYNTQTKESNLIISQSVLGFYETDTYYIFNNDKGLYKKNRITNEINLIMAFTNKNTFNKHRTEGINSKFFESDNKLYFVYNLIEYAQLNYRPDSDPIAQYKIYCYDLNNDFLSEVQNDGISKQNFQIFKDSLYYQCDRQIYKSSLDGTKIEKLYQTDSSSGELNINDEFISFIGRNAAQDKYVLNIISSNTFEIQKYILPFGYIEGIDYSNITNAFYGFTNKNELFYIPLENPGAARPIFNYKNQFRFPGYNILSSKDGIYFNIYNLENTEERYQIMKVDYDGNVITILDEEG